MATIRLAELAVGLVWVEVEIAEASPEAATWTVTGLNYRNDTALPARAQAIRVNGTSMRDAVIQPQANGSLNVTGNAASRQYSGISLGWPV